MSVCLFTKPEFIKTNMEFKKHIFTNVEKKCFMDLIKKYSRIIESKDTDGVTLRSKNEAWDKVTIEFNASPLATSQATHKQLRRLWMNLKQRQRESLSKAFQYRMATDKGESLPKAYQYQMAIEKVEEAATSGYELDILEREYKDRQVRADEKHDIEMQILREQLREQKAKADLAEFIFRQDFNNRHHFSMEGELSNGDVKLSVSEMEYKDQQKRANEKHKLELQIRNEQLRECKSKADLAEHILNQGLSPD